MKHFKLVVMSICSVLLLWALSTGPAAAQTITWDDNISENVQLDLNKTGAFNSTIAATELSDGSFTENIPGGTSAAILDTHFTIIVTAPNGGESWQAGTAHPITWIDNISENVIIELFKGGAFNSTIAATELSDGSFTWNIPGGTAAASDYTVVITSVNTGSITDVSDANFMITAPSDSCVTPPDSMVAWWTLDETSGTMVQDIVGGNNGTTLPLPIGPFGQGPVPSSLWPPPTFPPGMVGTSLFFYQDRHILVPDSPELEPGIGNFSLDAWIIYAAGGTQTDLTIVQKMVPPVPGGPGYRLIINDLTTTGGELSFEAKGLPSGGFDLNYFPITPNQWHHVAATILKGSPNDIVTLYLDGVPVVSIPSPTTEFSAADANLFIGGDGQFAGEIAVDEVEIFNRALTAGEINSIFLADSLGKCKPPPDTLGTICGTKFNDLNGDGVQNGNETGIPGWTINLSPVTGSTSTDSLGNYCFNNLPPGTYTITEEQRSGWTSTTPVSVTVTLVAGQTLTVNFGNQLTDCISPPDSMVAWWTLDETTDTIANDIAGFNNVGTYIGNPTPVQGKVAGGLSFGVNDYVRVSPHSDLDFGAGDFSIDAWINAQPNSAHPIVEKWEASVGSIPGYSFYLFGGQLTFSWKWSGGVSSASGGPNIADNLWHHVAVTIQRGNSQGKLYVDGTLVHTFDPKSGTVSNTVDLWIGRSRANPQPSISFKGVIDEVELFNRALDYTEVYEIWAADSLGKCKPPDTSGTICGTKFNDLNGDGVQDTTETGIPGWTIDLSGPVSGSTSTDSLGNYCFNNLPPGTYTITEEQRSGWTSTTPVSVTVTLVAGQTLTVNFGNQLANCVSPPDNMVAWWTLDETTDTIANDIAGFNNEGTHFGGPNFVPGKVAGALSFNGTTDYVEVANLTELNFGTGNFSIDAWILTNDAIAVATIVDQRIGTNNNPLGYSLYLFNGNLGFQLAAPLGNFKNWNSPAFVADGLWHHIAVTVARNDPDGLKFYVDGERVSTHDPRLYNGNLTNPNNPGVLRIASHSYDLDINFMYIGVVDELELFNRVLDSTEVYAIWAADSLGKCKPDSSGTICGTKFNDLNGDGVQNLTETGIPGWTIDLSGPVSGSTTTNSSGDYCFNNLPPGTYTITEEQRSGWTSTTSVSLTVTLVVGQTLTVNFGNQLTDCISPPESMVAWWTLDETSGTIADDIAGSVNNQGNYGGNPMQVQGKVASALSFNGKTDYVEVADLTELNFGTGNFSIDAWILTNDSIAVATIADQRTGTNNNPLGYSLYLFNGNLGFQLAAPQGNFTNWNSPAFVADGRWHHIAVTVARNDPSGLKFYVDGERVATFDPTPYSESLDLDSTGVFRIASHSYDLDINFMYIGVVDELELFNRVLDSTEVYTIWAADSLGKCKPPPDTLGTICGTKFNDLNGDGVQDSIETGIPGWTIILSGTDSTSTDSLGNYCFNNLPPGTYTVTEEQRSGWTSTTPVSVTVTLVAGQTLTVNFGNQLADCVSPPDSMVAWWTLDETTDTIANDIAGSVNNMGNYVGNPTPVQGKVDGGLSFGVNDYVRVPHQSELDFGAGDFSIDAWINAQPNSAHPIVEKWEAPVGSIPGYSFYLFGGQLLFSWSWSGGVSSALGGPNIADNLWHHVAVTIQRSNSQGKLYVDGTVVHTFDPKSGTVSNTVDLWIGRSRANPQPSISFKGVIDEVELFNRALDSTEIRSIWAADSLGKCKTPVSVDEDQTSQVPQQFLLEQNYPNPFNPSTTINYDLPEQSFVSITVYDILGRKVKILVNSIQDAGYKTVTWDATNEYGNPVSTGIYIYRMQAGAYVQTRKMILLK